MPNIIGGKYKRTKLDVPNNLVRPTSSMKREAIFTEILEGIHPSEVELLLQVKDKKLKCRGLTFNLVKETFPNLLP